MPLSSFQWHRLLFVLVLFTLRFSSSESLVPSDGRCNLLVFAPFSTENGQALTGINTNVGFSHMAAAFMAEKHFNSRNSTVVPELADLSNCNVTLEISNTSVLNTFPNSHLASQQLIELGFDQTPCSIVGPSFDRVALELSTMAMAGEYPIVVARAYNMRLAYERYNSFSISMYPDLASSGEAVTAFLQHNNRTSYIAMLYEISDTGDQRREVMRVLYDNIPEANFLTVGYVISDMDLSTSENQSPLSAMQVIRNSGFRTIILSMDDFVQSFQPIADAVEELNMNNGDYFFVWYDAVAPFNDWSSNTNISKLTQGSAWIFSLGMSTLSGENDPFQSSWKDQTDLVALLNAANPVDPGEPGYVYAEDDWFQTTDPEFTSAFMYDAVMSVGLGACNATKESSGIITGSSHHQSLRYLNYSGATGPVAFGQTGGYEQRNTRSLDTSTFAAINILPEGAWNLTNVVVPGSSLTWQDLAPFQYADGTNHPPMPLRDPPPSNYIKPAVRAYGLALAASAMGAAVASMLWLYVHRTHRIVTSSQPVFLYIVLFGTILQAAGIVTVSFDEGAGWSSEALSKACMATPWLIAIGYSLVYCALFTKLWRVHKVLQFTRRRVKIKHLVRPMLFIVLSTLVILALWTALDPLRWERTETNEITGESVGACKSENLLAFLIPLLLLNILATIMTCFMAYKTRDVDEALAESFWIFTMILVQLEAVVIAAPIALILHNRTTGSARYGCFIILIWILPASTICLLILPKVVMYYRSLRQSNRRTEQPAVTAKTENEKKGSGLTSARQEDANGADSIAKPNVERKFDNLSRVEEVSFSEDPSEGQVENCPTTPTATEA